MFVDLEKELAAALASPRVIAQFEQLIRSVVRDELARAGVGDELVDVPGAARLLNMSRGAVAKAVERGGLPCVRIGRRVRFRRSDLVARSGTRSKP